MVNKLKVLFATISIIFFSVSFTGAYFSDSVEISDNSFATSTEKSICQDPPAADFCPLGSSVVARGVDQNGCQIYACQSNISEILITEIMANPAAVSDSNGEWFEIYNSTEGAINLKGWRYRDGGVGNWSTITTDFEVGPKEYKVLIVNINPTENGGIISGYHLASSVNLANTRDEILIEKPNGDGSFTNVDTVIYNEDWPITSGKSIKLNNLSNDNSLSSSWSLSNTPYGLGDYGTPGATND